MTNEPELERTSNLYKSITIPYVKGLDIGIIGYLTPDTKFLAPKNKVEYEDEVVAIRREVSKLKEKGVKILIALGHSGFVKDLQIAKEVDGLDLVVGGHSNTFLTNAKEIHEIPEISQGNYPTVVKQKSGKSVLVVQAYAYTKYMGKLYLKFNKNGDIIHYSGDAFLLNQSISEDPELLIKVNKYRNEIDYINNEVVGTSNVLLDGKQCRLRECNMGSFITDTIVNYTMQYNEEYFNAKIAIVQGGRIRTSIDRDVKPYQVTRGDWISVVPFTDSLCILTVNGTILKHALEHSISGWRIIDTPGQFLQVSGIKVTYDLSYKPGSRVMKAKAVCSKCSKPEEIMDNHEYKIIMSSFLADGGDGYYMFESLPRETLVYNEITCILNYLKKYSPIHPRTTNRITILNEAKVESMLTSKPSRAPSIHFYIALLYVSLIIQLHLL